MAAKKKRERRRTMWWINGYDGDYRARDMMANRDGHRIYLGFPTEAEAEAALDRWLRGSPPLSETRATYSREPQPRAFMEKRYADGGGITIASFVARRGGVDGGGSTVYQWEREAR